MESRTNNIFFILNKIPYFLFQKNKAEPGKDSVHKENDLRDEELSKNEAEVTIQDAVETPISKICTLPKDAPKETKKAKTLELVRCIVFYKILLPKKLLGMKAVFSGNM